MKEIVCSTLMFLCLISCESKSKKLDEVKTVSASTLDTNDVKLSDNIAFEKVDTLFIRENFEFKGKVQNALKWKDKEGVHIVFTSETGVYHTEITEDETYNQNAEVFCFHYLEVKNKFASKWKIYDRSLKCPVDATAKFIKNSIEVTDINKNGVAEIWTMYRTACRGDVSPSELKLIMYEGDVKHKLEGVSKINYNDVESYGGTLDKTVNFDKKQDLLSFAKKKWEQNLIDTF